MFKIHGLFIVLLVLSLTATAAAVYWRSFMPEGAAPVSITDKGPTTRSIGDDSSRGPSVAPAREKAASDRQDLAVTISILSSVISALAALVQTWLTAQATPARRVRE